MSLGASDRDKIIRFGVIGGALLITAVYGYLQLRTPDAPAPVVAPSITIAPVKTTPAGSSRATTTSAPSGVVTRGAAATKVGTTSSQYDPSLRMGAMLVAESLKYSGTGRNIFSDTAVPPVAAIPKILAPVRTNVPVAPPVQQAYVPPPPPPIDLKFFGTATKADGSRQAFLLHGDDVFLAATGSIVQRRYKIGVISANTVEVEDLTNNNKQSLQLQRN